MKHTNMLRNSTLATIIVLALMFSMLFVFASEQNVLVDFKVVNFDTSSLPYIVETQVSFNTSSEVTGSLGLYYPRLNKSFESVGFSCRGICNYTIPVEEVYLDEYIIKLAYVDQKEIFEKEISFVPTVTSDPEILIRGQNRYLPRTKETLIKQTIINKEKLPLEVILKDSSNRIIDTQNLTCGSICYYEYLVESIATAYKLEVKTPFGISSKELVVLENRLGIDLSPSSQEDKEEHKGRLLSIPNLIVIGDDISIEVEEKQVSVDTSLQTRSIRSSNTRTTISAPVANKRDTIRIRGTRDLAILRNFYEDIPEDLVLEKPQKVKDLERKLNVEVSEVLDYTENRSSLRIEKNNVEIVFENISNDDLSLVEVIDYNTAQRIESNFTTPIVNVNAENFTHSIVVLPKQNTRQVSSILRCDNFIGNSCLSNWDDDGLSFTQNSTHVSFVIDQFSAYVGSGPTYNFTVEFTSLDDVVVREDNTTDLNITLSCADGNCGTLNITLYILENFTIFEDFESGFNTTLWQTGSSDGGGRTGIAATGTCGVTAFSGSNFFRMDRTPSGTFTSNYLKTIFDFTELRVIEPISYYLRETGDEDHTCGDHTGDTCNGEGFFYTCDGNQWYEVNQHTGLTTTFSNQIADVESDPDYCSPNSQNFSIKFTQYDNFPCTSDGHYYDDINLSGKMGRQINDSSSDTPFFIQGTPVIEQVTLLQDQSDSVIFTINASGLPDTYELYAVATASTDASIRAQSSDLNVSIQDALAPNGTKLNPIDGFNTSITDTTITFNASLEDDTGLASAILFVYDSSNVTRFEISTDLSGTSDTAEWNVTFVESGVYTWDVQVFDSGGLSNFTEGGRFTVNITFPYARVELYDPLFDTGKVENLFFNFTVNVTCYQNNCDEVNVSLLYPDEFNFTEGFEAGTLDGAFWENGSSDSGGRTTIETSTCGVSPRTGSNFFRADRNPSGTFTTNYLKTVYDFSALEIKNLSFYIRETGDEDHSCGDHFGDTCAGEGIFYTCNGNQWFELQALTGLSTAWTERAIEITEDPDFCSSITSNFAIKWTQYDNFPCTSDGHYYDDINITVSGFLSTDVNSGTPFWVNNSFVQTLTSMTAGESRLVTFVINASGTPGDTRDFVVRINSTEYSSFTDTTDAITITIINASSQPAPGIEFINPTVPNGSKTGLPLYINVSVNTTALDYALLELEGVNYTMTCGGAAPDLYCYVINDSLTAGNYSFRAFAFDVLNQSNITLNRTVEVVTDVPSIEFVFPTPSDNSVTSENITVQTSVSGTFNISSFIDFNNTLQGYWNFENLVSNNPEDNSTYSRATTSINISQGLINQTRGDYGIFDGTSSSVISSSAGLDGYEGLTIEAWVRPSSTLSGEGNILTKRDNSFSAYGLTYDVSSSDTWRFFVGTPGTNNVETPLTRDVWQHVASVYNGSHLVIYVDGVEQNSTAYTSGVPIRSTIDTVIGARRVSGTTGLTGHYNGSMDELRLWSRALTPDEIRTSFNASSVTQQEDYENLVAGAFYDFYSCVINEFGNQNCTESRTIQIGDSIPVIQTTPANNSVNYVGPGFNVSLVSDLDLYSVRVFLDGDDSVIYNLINLTPKNWTLDMTDNISIGEHNITFMYNQTSGFAYNLSNVSFILLRNYSIDVTKNIEDNMGDNQYIVNLTLANSQNTTVAVTLFDYVNTDFTAGSFNVIFNNNTLISSSGDYSGRIYSWNITLSPFETTEINYTLIGSGDYYNIRRFPYGLE